MESQALSSPGVTRTEQGSDEGYGSQSGSVCHSLAVGLCCTFQLVLQIPPPTIAPPPRSLLCPGALVCLAHIQRLPSPLASGQPESVGGTAQR